jgi:hypothetical protein
MESVELVDVSTRQGDKAVNREDQDENSTSPQQPDAPAPMSSSSSQVLSPVAGVGAKSSEPSALLLFLFLVASGGVLVVLLQFGSVQCARESHNTSGCPVHVFSIILLSALAVTAVVNALLPRPLPFMIGWFMGALVLVLVVLLSTATALYKEESDPAPLIFGQCVYVDENAKSNLPGVSSDSMISLNSATRLLYSKPSRPSSRKNNLSPSLPTSLYNNGFPLRSDLVERARRLPSHGRLSHWSLLWCLRQLKIRPQVS